MLLFCEATVSGTIISPVQSEDIEAWGCLVNGQAYSPSLGFLVPNPDISRSGQETLSGEWQGDQERRQPGKVYNGAGAS